jgi:alkylation response protein AidB-like acyl-CoA dehydrogenase
MPSPIASARLAAALAHELADEIDEGRRLPRQLVDRLVALGLFRLLVPASLGGGECDLPSYLEAIEVLAAADASTAWCVAQAASGGLAAARLPHDAAMEVFGDAGAIVAWGPGGGRAVPAGDGYEVTASVRFASGCRHATWLGAPATIEGGPGGVRLFLMPADRATFEDVWHVSGLRGTASDDFTVSDVPVRLERSFSFADPPLAPGPLYRFRSSELYAASFAAVALGTARGALDAFVALAAEKTARFGSSPVREGAVVQSDFAMAEASLRSARAFWWSAARVAWDHAVEAGGGVRPDDVVALRLASVHAIHSAAAAVDVVFHAAGSTAILEHGPLARRHRDVHTVTQQIQGRKSHFERLGRVLLGLDDAREFA